MWKTQESTVLKENEGFISSLFRKAIAGQIGKMRRWVSSRARALRESRYFIHIVGKLRRPYLIHFRKEFVRQQLLRREGACRQCGSCCNFLFTCPMLTKVGLCYIYGTCRPQSCKVFPIDQRDIREVELFGATCGYRFAATPQENTLPNRSIRY